MSMKRKVYSPSFRAKVAVKVVPIIWTEKVGGTRWMTNHANGLIHWSPGGVIHHVDEAADDKSRI